MNASSLVPDDLWDAIEPLLPKEPPKPKGGRPRIPDRRALCGIVFVLRTGCPWRLLPQELGRGSGSTCWRRLRDWQDADVWARLHQTLLNWLGDAAAIGWSRASIDSLSVRAKKGVSRQGQTRRIGVSLDLSTTWLSTAMASRWRWISRRPTRTIPLGCFQSSTLFLPSLAHVEDPDGLENGRLNSMLTRPTTPPNHAAPCGPGASPHALPDAGSTRPNGWAATAGWWSARWPGCSDFVGWACATSVGPTCFRACSTSAVPLSVSDSSLLRQHDERKPTPVRRYHPPCV
jgi:transposase